LHSRGLLVPLVVVALVGIVLLEGVFHRSRPAASGAAQKEEVGPPAPAGMRRPDLEKAPLAYLSEYWLQLGARTKPSLVLVGEAHVAGIAILPGFALAPLGALDGPAAGDGSVPAAPAPVISRVVAVDPDAGVALFELHPAEAIPPLAVPDVASAGPGTLIAAVSLAADGRLRVTPGHVVSVRSGSGTLDLSIPFAPGRGAAALVDLDGRLLGVAVPAGNSFTALSAEAALRTADRLRQRPRCEAVEVGPLDGSVRKLLGIDGGALVVRVRDRAFASPPEIRPGDVVRRWSGRAVGSPQEFDRLYDAVAPGSAVQALVRRGQADVGVSVVVPPDCRPFREPPLSLPALGLTVSRGEGNGGRGGKRSWSVLSVDQGGPAWAAGLEPGDRVLAVAGQPLGDANAAAVRQGLTGGAKGPAPRLISVERGGSVRLLVLRPTARGRNGQ
jgi:S1-C subfamily serine protease